MWANTPLNSILGQSFLIMFKENIIKMGESSCKPTSPLTPTLWKITTAVWCWKKRCKRRTSSEVRTLCPWYWAHQISYHPLPCDPKAQWGHCPTRPQLVAEEPARSWHGASLCQEDPDHCALPETTKICRAFSCEGLSCAALPHTHCKMPFEYIREEDSITQTLCTLIQPPEPPAACCELVNALCSYWWPWKSWLWFSRELRERSIPPWIRPSASQTGCGLMNRKIRVTIKV